jgi:biopolymer transport protein TolR
MRKHRKHLDFELNLIPFIDLLSTCICFLLLTAVWVNVGAMNVKQAVGGQAAEDSAKKPTVWVTMGAAGQLQLDARDSHIPANLAKLAIAPGPEGKPDIKSLGSAVEQMKVLEPGLMTALIQPTAVSLYEDIIAVMDEFKRAGVPDLGVSPL